MGREAKRISGRGRYASATVVRISHMITKCQLAKPSIMIFVSHVTKWLFQQKYTSGTTHYQHSARAVDKLPAPSIGDSGDDDDDALI